MRSMAPTGVLKASPKRSTPSSSETWAGPALSSRTRAALVAVIGPVSGAIGGPNLRMSGASRAVA